MNWHPERIDPRAWLVWGAAATLPPLLGRNPFPLIATLIAVVGVRLAWAPVARGFAAWSVIVRLAIVFALIGALFNVLTVRAGDRLLGTIPNRVPLIGGGELTLNALVYGLLGGLALLVLVLIGTTLGGLLDWSAIVRLLPAGLTSIAVAGSVAFAFIPQMVNAWGDIREAQAARGHRFRGARDLLPVVVPLISSGLERAITLSEALESRGFGAPREVPRVSNTWERLGMAAALTLVATAAYLLAVGQVAAGVTAMLLGAATTTPILRGGRARAMHRTRYRELRWSAADTAVAVVSAIAAIATFASAARSPSALLYEPYPRLEPPTVNVLFLVALLGLLTPAFFAPPPPSTSAV